MINFQEFSVELFVALIVFVHFTSINGKIGQFFYCVSGTHTWHIRTHWIDNMTSFQVDEMVCVNVYVSHWSTCSINLLFCLYEMWDLFLCPFRTNSDKCLQCTIEIQNTSVQICRSEFLFIRFFQFSGAKTDYVTCGSALKLRNVDYDVGLHSHDVRYGTGSGQQSVTGTEQKEDVNSYWTIWLVGDNEFSRG